MYILATLSANTRFTNNTPHKEIHTRSSTTAPFPHHHPSHKHSSNTASHQLTTR